VLSGPCAPRALTVGGIFPRWQTGPTTTAAVTQPYTRHHHGAVTGGPWQAVTSACPLRPLRAQPRRLKRRTCGARLQSRLRALNGPVPYQVRKTLEAARAPGSNKYDPRRVRISTSGLEARLKQAGATGALDSRETTDQRLENWRGQGPSKPADAKDGSTQLLPRTALLIRGSKPDPRRVRTGAPDHQSQGRRGHTHSSLSSSPPARGCPTCRVREPARAASRGDPTEGELPRPWSLANGTEPHLANPRKRFNGRVSGPRSLPLSNGAWAST
jgi:hypothetical protein